MYFSTHDIRMVKIEAGEIQGSYFLNRRIKNAYMVIFRPENISRIVLFSTYKRWERIEQNMFVVIGLVRLRM